MFSLFRTLQVTLAIDSLGALVAPVRSTIVGSLASLSIVIKYEE